MAQLNSSALSALNAAVGGRSDPASGRVSNTPAEQKGFAEMMAGAIQNQSKNLQAQGVAGRSQVGADAKAANINQTTGSVADQSGIPATGQTTPQQMASALQQRISSLQEKISALSNQNPPLSDKAQAALSTLTQQLAALKSQLKKGGGSSTLDGNSLSMWLAQLDKVQTLLQQGDINAASWTGQLQAMVQHLTQMNQQTDVAEARVGQTSAGGRSAHSALASDAQQTSRGGPTTKDVSGTLSQGMDPAQKDNLNKNNPGGINHRIDNQTQFQNNPTVSGERAIAALVSGQMQSLSGVIGSALSAQTINVGSTLNSLPKGMPKSDLTMQSADSSGNNAAGTFNLSTSGFGAVANTTPVVTLPGTLALNQPRMAADLGQNIQLMVGKNISRATLDVNPAHLGPMKITIDQQNNQTTIQIMASHHLAKDMLDQNMPRLHEWLQDAGLGNTQVTVMSGGHEGSNNQAMNQGGSQGFGDSAGAHGASTAQCPVVVEEQDATGQGASENKTQAVTARWRLDTFA
ncbi:flagellar hook-length control protein FliK [Halothiobacillus sp.]|uniref:flagellar hook-length control protein FliK n=1 Tax=Halothiobacillus sp. TaxID=1891311 RepID=UPI002611A9E8|nr:flagellar hook-length control protein FliK [Halothiobacillus sp.]